MPLPGAGVRGGGGGQWLTCPHPWEPVFRELTTCVVMAGPGPGPGDQSRQPGPHCVSSVLRAVHGKPLGAVGRVTPPPAQIPLPTARAGRGSGQVRAGIGPGAEEGKVPWPLLRERRQSSLSLPTLKEGCGGLWVGMVLVKVGQVPALCSAAEGASRRSGDSVGKGLCSSTSSIPYSPQTTPSLLAGEHWLPIWDGPGLLTIEDA